MLCTDYMGGAFLAFVVTAEPVGFVYSSGFGLWLALES